MRKVCLGVAILLAFLASAAPADAGQPSSIPTPSGTALYLQTSDLASLERAILSFSNSFSPAHAFNQAALDGGPGMDQIFDMIQRTGNMPPLADPLVQQFFSLPGFEMDRARGVALAYLIPRPEDGEDSRSLAPAYWLPVRSFQAIANGIRQGRPEWRHISELPDQKNVFRVINQAMGYEELYLKGTPVGVVLSTTLWGLERAEKMWSGGPAAPGLSGGGFAFRVSMDFAAPGASEGWVKLLSSPTDSLARRLRQGAMPEVRDYVLKGLLHLLVQANSLQLDFRSTTQGLLTADATVVAKPASALSTLLGNSVHTGLRSRLMKALPRETALAFACASGPGIKNVLADSFDAVISGLDDRDAASQRTGDILAGVKLLLEATDGEVAAGITVDGAGVAAFDSMDPERTRRFVDFFSRVGDSAAVRQRENSILVGLGPHATRVAEEMESRMAAADDSVPVRESTAQLLDSLGPAGVFAAVGYPADIARLVLTYQINTAYATAGGRSAFDKDSPLEMFALAYLGRMAAKLNSMEPGRYALTLGATTPNAETLRMHARLSMMAMSELMGVYQNYIAGMMPIPFQANPGRE